MDNTQDIILEIIEGLEKLMDDLKRITSEIIVSFQEYNEEADKTKRMLSQAKQVCNILKKADHTRNN